MNEPVLTIQGPLVDPTQAAAARDFAVRSVIGLALFFGLLYWWANR